MIFPSRAASNIVAGLVLAMLGTIIWAATMMTWRDWLWFLLFAASCAALIYFRAWARLLSGFRAKSAKGAKAATPEPDSGPSRTSLTSPPSREPQRPLILSLYESGAIVNGRPHHQPKNKLP